MDETLNGNESVVSSLCFYVFYFLSLKFVSVLAMS